jgi:hypothetical protein
MKNVDYQLNKNQIDNMENIDTIKAKGTYNFKHYNINGVLKDEWNVDNLIVNAGLAGLIACADFKYIALGTGTTAVAASQTALAAEITDSGLQRVEGTVTIITTTVTNDTKQITYTFTATGTKAIEEVGIFSAASAGTMLSRALTSTKTLVSGEKLVVTYKLKQA